MATHARYQTNKTTVKYPKDQFVIATHPDLRPHVLQEHFHLKNGWSLSDGTTILAITIAPFYRKVDKNVI